VEQPASHRKPAGGRAAADIDAAERSDARIAGLSYAAGTLIGATQILALLAGISRSGVAMAGGLWRGLDHEDAARFAFLLATPVILAAGVLKVPSLLGPAGAHIHGQVVLGVIVCGIAAYMSVRFLVRWFQTRTLTPFAVYCLAFGALSILRFFLAGQNQHRGGATVAATEQPARADVARLPTAARKWPGPGSQMASEAQRHASGYSIGSR
jgi:undecaprenyl-diphosphatase